ncbi:hypothetical protein [Acinetobacter stercoris]|uniref:Uncharacterized protein n=1 Tax=Acinetobacter stercoris TaxID=2126983 RepID=A0A2U3MZN1_9GAMM|nr:MULTISPECIES: hypothetical protein [Acinetobacter]SPL70878.1 hypothetical protein KPC_2056 [Acinetobacter stercoris]
MVREDQTGIWENLGSILDVIPEDSIAVAVYILGALIILWCWYEIQKRLPQPLGGITWVIVFALIATPSISEGPNSSVAPAFFGFLFGLLTKDSSLIWSNLSLMTLVIGLGLVIGYFWSKYVSKKSVVDNSSAVKSSTPL